MTSGKDSRACLSRCQRITGDAFSRAAHPSTSNSPFDQGSGVNRPLSAVPVELDAMRVACPVQRGLDEVIQYSFTSLHLYRSVMSVLSNLVVRLDSPLRKESGRCGQTLFALVAYRAVRCEVGEIARRAIKSFRGVRELHFATPFNSGRRGEPSTGDSRSRVLTTLGYRSKSANVKSSTMKGPRGLVGKLPRRRCRNV